MKSYSEHNFIQEYIKEAVSGRKSLWGVFFGNPDDWKSTLTIRISYYDFLQAETFIEDMIEWAGVKNLSFPLELLIALTYKEFLNEIRGDTDILGLSQKLAYKKKILYPEETKVEFRHIAPNHQRRFEYQQKKSRSPILEVTTEIERKYIRRGEMFLLNAHHLNPDCQLHVEELISILIRDLVSEIERGRKEEVMETLLFSLSHKK